MEAPSSGCTSYSVCLSSVGLGWSSSWFWRSSCAGFPRGSLQHTQFLVKGLAGLLCDFMFNPVPDGHLQTLHHNHTNQTLLHSGHRLLSKANWTVTFFSFCCWTTWAFLGAMILPGIKRIRRRHCEHTELRMRSNAFALLLITHLFNAVLRSEYSSVQEHNDLYLLSWVLSVCGVAF